MKLLGWLLLTVVCAIPASGKFERPSETERLRAPGNLSKESDPFRQLLTPTDDFSPIHLPGRSDWLAQHTEKGQLPRVAPPKSIRSLPCATNER